MATDQANSEYVHVVVTQDNVLERFDFIFAPWIKQMGLTDWQVEPGRVRARLPQSTDLQFFSGAICGQAIMAVIDTVMSMAMGTSEQFSRGTSYQHTHFLRPAAGQDLLIDARVVRFGRSSHYGECWVTYAESGREVAHATLEFAG
ncbi:MAG: PaaI family thioesterase [Pseudomonadota bacterium]